MSLIPSKQNEPSDARLRQHVAVETREGVRAQAVAQEAVAADARVQHAHRVGRGRRLQAAGQHVRPPVVAIGGGSASVRDGVAEDHDGARPCGREHVDAGEDVPVIDRHGVGQSGSRHGLSGLKIRGGARSRVACHFRRRAPHVDRHRQVRERRQFELDRVAEQRLARRVSSSPACPRTSARDPSRDRWRCRPSRERSSPTAA